MVRAALKGVFANTLRLALTGLAIVIGVAFVAGIFVFTDSIKAGADELLSEVNAGTDVVVRPTQPEFGFELVSMPEAVLDDVLTVEGVAVAEGSAETFAAQVISADGEPIGGQGPPTLGTSWIDDDAMNPLAITAGRAPEGPSEVMLDTSTAESAGVAVGDDVDIILVNGPATYELVGIATFGEENALLGATLAVFELQTAQAAFGLEGQLSSIVVRAEEGVSPDALTADIAPLLPAGVEVITAEAQTNEAIDDLNSQLGILNTVMLVFAAVAVFVGGFIIFNTFRIIVAQRTRELALMRAVGATGSQVTWMIVLEALAVAVVASIVGVLAGIGLAAALAWLASQFNVPTGNLTIAPRTVVWGMVVGLTVTLVAAVVPARKAASVPPVAAMSWAAGARPGSHTTRRRLIAGTVLTVLGIAALGVGLFGSVPNGIALVGVGALLVFLGVAVLAYVAARPVAAVLGWPLPRLLNATGKLAQENTKREPVRTATTASALMIGIALVVFITVVASSFKQSIEETIFADFPADFTAASTNFTAGMPQSFTVELGELDEISVVSAVQGAPARAGEDQTIFILGADPRTINDVFSLEPSAGALDRLSEPNSVMIQAAFLEDEGLAVGGTVPIEYATTGVIEHEIVGTFVPDSFGPQPLQYLVSTETFRANVNDALDFRSFALKADDVTLEEARAAVDEVAAAYPNVLVETKSEFIASTEAQIDQALLMLTLLLLFTVIIAVLGIVNTLALSVFERTREIGLLRAVGMRRRQIGGMVIWEAVLIALFGAIIGIGLGIVFGWAVIQALSDQGLGAFSLPWEDLAVYLVIAGIAGAVAAIFPARKASRLNILEAIAYE